MQPLLGTKSKSRLVHLPPGLSQLVRQAASRSSLSLPYFPSQSLSGSVHSLAPGSQALHTLWSLRALWCTLGARKRTYPTRARS